MMKPLIMVVDDEKDIADSITELLKDTGKYDVITCYSAPEALKMLKSNKRVMGLIPNRVRCIILDIKMPEMDGLEFLEKIRKEYMERIGVIILSAWEDEEKWEKARQGMVVGYITKPFNPSTLLNHLEDFFAGNEEHMMDMTNLRTNAKEFALRVKREFDPEKIRERVRKKMDEEEKEREREEEERKQKKKSAKQPPPTKA